MFENLESRLLLSVAYPDLQSWSQPSDNPALQGGMDTFAPPVDSQVPGSSNPGLAELTRSGKADDALALTGYQFSSYTGADLGKDTQFVFWSQTSGGNGALGSGSILHVEGAQAAVTIPSTALNNSMYLVWAQNSAGPSYPLAINKTEAWWTGSSIATRGQSISVFGRNLSYYDSTYTGSNLSWIYLKPTSGGAGQWVTPTAVNPYKVDFTVPGGLANGTYEVWVHNGHGGKYGWSRSDDLTVQDPIAWNGVVRNVKHYGAVGDGVTDDSAAINAAIAESQPGDKIYFPTGTYACGATTQFVFKANTQVYGDGMNSSTINTSIKLQGYSKINDLKVDSGTSATISTVTGTFNWLTNTWFSMEDGNFGIKTLDTSSAGFVYYTGCKFTGQAVWIGAKYDHYFDDCDFYGRYDTEMNISSWGSNRVSVTNCTFQHYDMTDPNSNSGWGEGRVFTNTCDWNAAGKTYFGGNTITDYSVRNGTGADQNSGEMIMNESGATYYTGGIVSATATTVTFASTVSTGSTIAIVSGKGLGQIRHVVAYNASTYTLTVDQPWNVTPDAASIVQLMRQPEKFAVYNNYFDGRPATVDQAASVANAGVDMFTGGFEWLVDKNTFHEMRTGVNWTNYGSAGVMGINFSNYVVNNSFDYVRWAGTESGSSQTYVNSLMNVWRDNTVNNVRDNGAAFKETGGTGSLPSPMLSIFDDNHVTNAVVGYQVSQTGDTHNTIFNNNSFDRGTATLAGSKGIDFGVTTTDLAGKQVAGGGWSGAWVGISSSGNEHAKYFNQRQLSLGTTGYSNTGNQSDNNDGAAGQTVLNNRIDRFTDHLLTTGMTGTVWVSALINRYEAQETVVGFNPTSSSGGGKSHNTFIGLNGANQAVLNFNGTAYNAAVTANLNTTYLLLAKIEVNYSGTFDRVTYWFNPTNLTGGEAGLGAYTLMHDGTDSVGDTVAGVGVNILRSSTATDTNLLDAIRLSNNATSNTALSEVLSGSGTNLVADYFNETWGPVPFEPVFRNNTVTNFETQYADNLPKPGGLIESPNHTATATGSVGGSSVQTTLTVWNAGIESMTWNASDDASWLTLSSTTGTLAEQTGVSTLTATCDPTGLAAGVYTATVTLTANEIPTRTLSVVFTVNPAVMPSITIAATTPNAAEPSTNGVFTVTRSGSTTGDLTVYYHTAGTATSGSDYTALTGSVVILNGQSTATIPVTVTDDAAAEKTESVIVAVVDGPFYTVGATPSATVTIADNDTVATPAVSVAAGSAYASERGSTPGTFILTRASSISGDLTVNYTLTGTATSGTDYTSLPQSVVIPDGQASATVTVTPLTDNLTEGNETVILTVISGTGYTVGSPSSDTVNIADNGSSSTVGNVISAYGSAGNGWAGGWTITSTSGNEHAKFLFYKQLTYNTTGYSNTGNEGDTNDGAAGQTVYNNRDDRNSERLLTTPITSGTVWVSALVSLAESLPISMGFNPNGGAGGNSHKTNIGLSATNQAKLTYNGTAYTATVNAPLNTTHLMLAKIELNYDGTNDRVSYWLDPNLSGGEGGLGYATFTQQGADTIGTTFTGIGITSQRSTTALDSNLIDAIRISNSGTGFTDVTQGTGAGLIAEYFNNYAGAAPPTVTASATDNTATEAGTTTGTFTVTRVGTSGALTVYYMASGTATSGTDYTALTGSVTIANGQTSATVTVTPVNDNWIETDETVILTVMPGTNYTVGSPNSDTVTLTSDDLPTVTLSGNDTNGTEAAGDTGSFTLTRTGLGLLAGYDLAVNASTSGTATNGTDYSLGTLTIPANQTTATVTLTPVDDNLLEGSESATLTLASGSYTIGGQNNGTVNITDDLAKPAPSSPSATTVSDVRIDITWTDNCGNETGFYVDQAIDSGFTQNLVTTSTTASPFQATGLSASTTYYFRVRAYNASGSSSNSSTVSATTQSGTTVSIVATDPNASERGTDTGVFTITRTGPTTSALTVNYTISGTATNGTDYTSIATSVTIPSGSVSTTVTITPSVDVLIEGNETATLTLAAGGYTVGSPSSDTVTIADDSCNVTYDLAGRGSAGNGWAAGWVSASSDIYNVHTKFVFDRQLLYTATGYSNTGNSGGLTDGAAGQAPDNTRVDRFTDRMFTSAMGTGTVWASVLVNRFEAQTIALGFHPLGTTGANSDNTYIGLGAANQAVMNYNGTTYTASVTANLNTTYLLLAKVEMNYSGTYDRVSYWFNPSLSGGEAGLGTPTIMKEGVDSIGATMPGVGALVLRNTSQTNTNLLDAIRVSNSGTGFTDVTQGTGASLISEYFNGYGSSSTNVTIVPTDNVAAEAGADPGTFTFYRNGNTGALTVNYTISTGGSNATNGTDYNTIATSVVIPDGASSATVTFTPIDDAYLEGSEPVQLNISASANYTIGWANYGLINITDNDKATDGFESNNWTGGSGWAGNWTASGSASIVTGQAHTATYALQLTSNNGIVTRAADLSHGHSGTTLTFWWKANTFAAGDTATVELYNGTSWTTVTTISDGQDDNAYHQASINLGSYLTSGFQLRIASHMAAGAYFYVDDLTIQ